MNPYTTRRWGAIAAGCGFAAVTAYVLLEDVLAGSARIGTPHVLTLATLAGTILAGHWVLPALRAGRIVAGLGLVAVFAAGTVYLVIAASARNAEKAGAKSAEIHAANAVRSAEQAMLDRARAMLSEAQEKLARECGSGPGQKCRGIQTTIDVYEASILGHQTRLAKLAPLMEESGGYAHVARVIAALPGVSDDPRGIERSLVLVMPVLIVIICELATVVFLGLGLGHGRIVRVDRPALPAPSDRPMRIVRDIPERPVAAKKAAVLAALRAGQSAGSSREFAAAHGVPRSTMSDWLREWEASGAIRPRRTDGRAKAIVRRT